VVALTTQTAKYTLREARQIHGMTRKDLVKASGISMTTIQQIEGEGSGKTHIGVAELLAEELGLEVCEIKWPRGITHRGRPPLTGVRITTTVMVETEQICPVHYITLPVTGDCDMCA
jgi:transcriptional regulator with XRE-family HTH domain